MKRRAEKVTEEMLNNLYPPAKIGGREYGAGTILRKCDPTAFRCAVWDCIEDMLRVGAWIEEGKNLFNEKEV